MSKNRFIDDVIEHIESDIEKIRVKPNMYISFLNKKWIAVRNPCWEQKKVVKNSVYEYL